MGLFVTRIDNKEVSHVHRERHEKTVKHVRATPKDAHRELRDIKEEARDVLLEQMEVQNTSMNSEGFQLAMMREPHNMNTQFLLNVRINERDFKMRQTLAWDDKILDTRDSYDLTDRMSRFLEKNFTEVLLKETE